MRNLDSILVLEIIVYLYSIAAKLQFYESLAINMEFIYLRIEWYWFEITVCLNILLWFLL